MNTIEKHDMGKHDEKGSVFSRVIVGKNTETKPTGFYEDIPLREGDMFIEYGGSGSKVYIYDEDGSEWVEM